MAIRHVGSFVVALALFGISAYSSAQPIEKDLERLIGEWRMKSQTKDKDGTITRTDIRLTFVKGKVLGIVASIAGKARAGPNKIVKFEDRDGKRFMVLENDGKSSSVEYKIVGDKLVLTGKGVLFSFGMAIDLTGDP